MEGRRIKVWLGHADVDAPLPKPTLPQLLYSPPNPDGTRKMCRNCVLWMGDMAQCFIHDSSIPVPPDAVCGRHVFGQSIAAGALSRENLEPVRPEYSGLGRVPGGASCDRCCYYNPRGQLQGVCRAVSCAYGGSTLVQALGFCSMWTEE